MQIGAHRLLFQIVVIVDEAIKKRGSEWEGWWCTNEFIARQMKCQAVAVCVWAVQQQHCRTVVRLTSKRVRTCHRDDNRTEQNRKQPLQWASVERANNYSHSIEWIDAAFLHFCSFFLQYQLLLLPLLIRTKTNIIGCGSCFCQGYRICSKCRLWKRKRSAKN